MTSTLSQETCPNCGGCYPSDRGGVHQEDDCEAVRSGRLPNAGLQDWFMAHRLKSEFSGINYASADASYL